MDHVTEVGISVLDLGGEHAISAQDQGQGSLSPRRLVSAIDAHHFRVHDKGRYIFRKLSRHGDPLWCGDRFAFGTSQWVFTSRAVASIEADLLGPILQSGRPIIVVGHAYLENDSARLRNLGVRLVQPGQPDPPVADTQVMGATAAGYPQPGLKRLLQHYSIEPLHLHNGGNDAFYTLVLALRMALEVGAGTGRFTLDCPRVALSFEMLAALRGRRHGHDTSWPTTGVRHLGGVVVCCNICGYNNHRTEDCRKMCIQCRTMLSGGADRTHPCLSSNW